jgi:hypothetical protein
MLSSRDMPREEMPNNGYSTQLIRLSTTTTGRTMLWKSKITVETATLEQLPVSLQDGGRCSD